VVLINADGHSDEAAAEDHFDSFSPTSPNKRWNSVFSVKFCGSHSVGDIGMMYVAVVPRANLDSLVYVGLLAVLISIGFLVEMVCS